MKELARNAKFEPFNLEGDFNSLINQKPIEDTRPRLMRWGEYALNDESAFTKRMTETEDALRKQNMAEEERFLKMCYDACRYAFETHIKQTPIANY
jgi:hypothetical protein